MRFSRQEYWSGVPLPSPSSCITDSEILGQEKEAVTPQETDPELPVDVQESLAEAGGWVGGGLLPGWGHCV